ncbi:ech hydrogenase subunit B [Candidatus Omnitrophus magneticus]|uniref:Ech hydrogenase subunit B n=1 Tax=Candidatus Omnitrophus magneticus TaxID=1609969 RepID=A0A0F0CRM4_9BACT|nr:ech hydrogenase subunit B [Candidatus Omnitrophus magneticus]
MNMFIKIILYLFLTPILGGLLSGIDRKLSARMQERVGPPIWQPFMDVLKLFEKENLVVRRSQNFYVFFYFLLIVFAGGLFFTGKDMLLFIFALTLAGTFFILAGYKASSPYSFIGAEREILQMISYEPALLFGAIGLYMVSGSFSVSDIISSNKNIFLFLPGVLFSIIFILAIKFRKSPFDLSTSHHAHQELIKGITTEFSGETLALIEIAHWYEYVFVLGIVYLFFSANPILGIAVCGSVFFLMILIDNVCARVKWQMILASSWIIALVFGLGNIMILFFFMR